MVTSNHQGLVEVTTLTVQFLVAVLGVEHFVQNVEWHVIAHLFEAVLIDVGCALIDTGSALTLMAGGQNRFEFSESFQNVLLACFLGNHFY